MPLSLETCIQQLLESVGPSLGGRVTWVETRKSPNDHTTDITVTVSCARSSDMEATMEDRPRPSPDKPSYLRLWLGTFSPNTLPHSLRIFDGTVTLTPNSEQSGILQRLLDADDGSLADGMIQLPSGKRLHMTLRVVSRIS